MSVPSPIAGICADRRCDRGDDLSRKVWYCSTCASCLCEKCWDFSPIHSASGAARHEKLVYGEYLQCKRLSRILSPSNDATDVENQHGEDTSSTWFGIDRSEDGHPSLQDFEIYSQIMANLPGTKQERYPHLVSFVGETGAGKSTVVQMLIDQAESMENPEAAPVFPTPVAGSPTHDSIPTSADVHLYCDPATCEQERPILYADCEGLNAGERTPIGAHIRRSGRVDNSKRSGLRVRPLEWASGGERSTRQFAVTQLYPRLLYTFSDVVVFVLKEPKTFGSAVLPKLLTWAFALLEASTNQGTLPHAVIVLNCSKSGIRDALWELRDATNDLLSANSHVLQSATGHPEIIKYADKWRRKGKPINNILDLIHCYYASFNVVRLPDEKNLLLLYKQVTRLRLLVSGLCEDTYVSKKNARLLATADDFGFYMQQAFSHYSKRLDEPFDFKECSLRRNPIPKNLGDHILRMAITIQSQFPDRPGPWIFQKLSFMVASCFLYDCVSYRKGQPQDLFGDYTRNFEHALEEFCSTHWPCEFRNKKGRCVNVSKRHGKKGHQNSRGKVLAVGAYESKFNPIDYKDPWMNALKIKLADLQDQLRVAENFHSELGDPLRPVREQHLKNIGQFYWDMKQPFKHRSGAWFFQSHGTCLCCLMRAPEYALKCGHVLCSKCVEAFGKIRKSTFELEFCPLHKAETQWSPPWKIRTKPKFAGVRVLTLDGGGIRGIAELEILRQLQTMLEVNIPISIFFDLIVGTSTGGIIALALGVKQWSVEQCITEFTHLCDEAFTPRELHGLPGLQQMATFSHGSKWATSPFYKVLGKALGKQFLFGGDQDSDTSYAARVAVTSSNEVATRGIVIANYSRRSTSQNYDFLRPTNPDDEMKIWEAAAATAAATPYFKPFTHPRTQATYLDGAFHNNNPVKVGHMERQLIWTDVQDKPPDLLLSLGTCQHREKVREELQAQRHSEPNFCTTTTASPTTPKASSKWKHFVGMLHVGRAAYNRLEDVINCERQWQEFISMVVQPGERLQQENRYLRLNPDIGKEPPALDAKADLRSLQNSVSDILGSYNYKLYLEQVVFRLVASSFYFEKERVIRHKMEGTATVTGSLQCRFEESSDWLKEIGRFFKKRQRAGDGENAQPYFEVRTGDDRQTKKKVIFTETDIDKTKNRGDFNLGAFDIVISTTESDVDIRLCLYSFSGDERGFSISGFPRDFLTEDSQAVIDFTGPKSRSSGEERPQGARANTFHGQESLEQGQTTHSRSMSEEAHRKSDELVAKPTMTLRLREALTHRTSRASLRTTSAPVSQVSTPQQTGEAWEPPQPGEASTPLQSDSAPQEIPPHNPLNSQSVPSLLFTPPAPDQAHASPARPNLPSISTFGPPASDPPQYIPDTPTATNPTPGGHFAYASSSHDSYNSQQATPRSSLSTRPTLDTTDNFDKEIETAMRASLEEQARAEEERDILRALENSLLDQ